jgi:hypothetical protein
MRLALLALTLPLTTLATVHKVPADHSTIQTAIDAASPYDLILVSPGAYPESLTLKPNLTLKSLGDNTPSSDTHGLARAEKTIITGASLKHPGVTMAAGSTLDGFTITSTGTYDDAKWQAAWDTKGENQSHDHIGHYAVPAISVDNIDATVTHCRVHHNGHTGIAVRGPEDPTSSAPQPRISHNHCWRNMGAGIGLMRHASATVSYNDCFENFYAGIGHNNASPLVSHNTCHHNIRAGIGISEGSAPVVRHNDCYENRRAGIGTRTGETTRPVIEHNRCHHNVMAGIGTEDHAAPIIRHNHCEHNELAAIGARSGATPIIVNNTAIAKKLVALGLPNGSRAVVVGNTFSRPSGGAPPIIAVLENSTAVLVGNHLSGGGIASVLVKGTAILHNNTFTNTKTPVRPFPNATVIPTP